MRLPAVSTSALRFGVADYLFVPVNIRVGRRYKQALSRIASRRRQPMSELIREILERYVAQEERRAWQAEARRAAEALAEEARQSASPESATLRMLDAI